MENGKWKTHGKHKWNLGGCGDASGVRFRVTLPVANRK